MFFSRIIPVLTGLCALGGILSAQTDSLCEQQYKVIGHMQHYHISPPEFTPNVNQEVLELFLDHADPRGLFILQPDKDRLHAYTGATPPSEVYCGLLHQSTEIMTRRIRQVDSILTVIESNPLNFAAKDSITFLAEKEKHVASASLSALRQRMERRIKYECLGYVLKPTKENGAIELLSPKEIESKQAEAKKIALVKFRRYLTGLSDAYAFRHQVADALSNAIALRCDPHSNFFNYREKEIFDDALSTDKLSFGFYVDDNTDGEVSISELVPGGAAWKSNELHEGDVILGFRFGDQAQVDLQSADADEFSALFAGYKENTVELTLRRKDNQVKKVTLHKSKITSTENAMSSFVLDNQGERFGYIPLPSFYINDESEQGLGCANDVAKEILKLKTENISGLIIDLRYNGGGSMSEAIGLAGIFINEGPVAVYTRQSGKPVLLRDMNRGTIYDGPLVVLINSYSASASEFLAAALQDYNRALIVGSTSFGKGTAQNILPLDSIPPRSEKEGLGFVKITGGKFYRVKTISHQGKGIVPDVRIPDITEKFARKEADEPFALASDSVAKKVVFAPLAPLPVAELQSRSSQRLGQNKNYTALLALGDSLSLAREKRLKVALNLNDYKRYYQNTQSADKRIDALASATQAQYTVENNSYTKQLIGFDEYQHKLNTTLIEGLQKDAVLNECYSVLHDLIQLQPK